MTSIFFVIILNTFYDLNLRFLLIYFPFSIRILPSEIDMKGQPLFVNPSSEALLREFTRILGSQKLSPKKL